VVTMMGSKSTRTNYDIFGQSVLTARELMERAPNFTVHASREACVSVVVSFFTKRTGKKHTKQSHKILRT